MDLLAETVCCLKKEIRIGGEDFPATTCTVTVLPLARFLPSQEPDCSVWGNDMSPSTWPLLG